MNQMTAAKTRVRRSSVRVRENIGEEKLAEGREGGKGRILHKGKAPFAGCNAVRNQ